MLLLEKSTANRCRFARHFHNFVSRFPPLPGAAFNSSCRMLEVRYNPQFPPLISLCVSSLMGRGFSKCIPDPKSAGALVFAGSVAEGSQRELMTDVACAKLLCQLSRQALPLYPSSSRVASFGVSVESAAEDTAVTTGAAADATAAAVDLLTPIDGMISLALAAQATAIGGAAEAQLLSQLSSHLQLRTFLAARHLTLADLAVYSALKRLLATGTAAAGAVGAEEAAGTGGVARGVAAADSGSPHGGVPALWEKRYPHLARWFALLDGHGRLSCCVTEALRKAELHRQQKQKQQRLPSEGTVPKNTSSRSEGRGVNKGREAGQQASYEGKLEGAVVGEVVTRFPPEPSGYLHIGHAKAALLNDYFAKKYKGKMLFRFDDTNPAKEKEEFEDSIREDLKLLRVEWAAVSHSSDYFEQMQTLCERLIREGKFYVDDTPMGVMREQRAEGIASCRRDDSIEDNLTRWREMLVGSAVGVQCCVRARIDMQSKNKCLRDPVMYRCIPDIPHHRCGTRFKIYPTYDFACPVIDALEGVTHALRTNEYADRIPQYHWVQEAAGLRRVQIYEFSRLCFVRTLLSKRKLKYFVDNKLVDGWDDPRMPTVRGITRRGLQVEALLDFMLEQGASKAGNLMEWDKLWTINKQRLDPIVPRYMAVGADAVPVLIKGAPPTPERKSRRLHAKNEALGSVDLWFCNQILIDRDDAALCSDGEEVTLMHVGNCFFDKIVKSEGQDGSISHVEATLHLEGDFKKTKKKLHWVPDLTACPAATPSLKNSIITLREFDHLITADKIEGEQEEAWEQYINKQTVFDTPALGDPLLRTLPEGTLLQLERRGYFRVDQTGEKVILIKIPDGKSKAMSVVSSKVDAAKLTGTKKAAKK